MRGTNTANAPWREEDGAGQPGDGARARRLFLRHGRTILRVWGAGCFLACLRAALSSRPTAFHEALCRRGVIQPGGRP